MAAKVVPIHDADVTTCPVDDYDPDTIMVVPEEDPKEKEKREKEEEKNKMQEFGKPVSFRKLCSLATWPELFVYALAWFGAIAHGAAAPALCLIFGNMVDGFGSGNMLDDVLTSTIHFCLIGAAVIVVGWIQEFGFPWFAERVSQRARPLYFHAALHRDINWYDTHEIGSFPAEMSQDIENLGDALGSKVGISVMALAQLVLGFALGFWKGWLLALIISVSMPLMAVGTMAMGSSMEDIMNETQSSYAKAAVVVEEVLYAVRTVVSFGGEKREIARFEVQAERARAGGARSRLIAGAGMGYIWCMMFMAYALAFYAGMMLRYEEVKDADGGVYGIGRILTVFFAVLTGGFSLGQVPAGLMLIARAKQSSARMFHIMETQSVIQRVREDDRKAIDYIQSMELKDVHFSYPARPEVKVLNGLNLRIEKGQKVAVVGESGSGKSTVMALLERFYDPLVGSVLVNDTDLRSISVKSYRKQIGYVGQEPVMFATSIRENILQGRPGATSQDLLQVADEAQLTEFINKLPEKFDTYVGSGGSQFSGGQKQRIAIARALIKKPSVLFLDEATSALDSRSEKMIQSTIDSISSKSTLGITIVSIAHRLSTVRNSDVIYVLSRGVVAESGTHEELVQSRGLYHALAATQVSADSEETAEASKDDEADKAQTKAPKANRTTTESLGNDKEELTDEEKAREAEIQKTYKVPLTRLFKYCKREWPLFVPGIIGAGLHGASMPVVGGVILSEGMNAFFNSDKEKMRDEIETTCIYFLIGSGAILLGNVLAGGCFGYIGEALTKRIRMELMTSVLRQEIGFHDDPDHTAGRLCKAFQVYANRVSAFTTTVGDKFSGVMTMLTGLILAFVYSWMMALAILLTVPFMGVANMIQMQVQMGSSKAENTVLTQAQQVVSDAIMSIRTVHACGNENEVHALYCSLLSSMSVGSCKKHMIGGLAFGISDSVQYFVMGAGFWWMGWLIENNHSTFSEAMSAFMGLMFAAMAAGMAASMAADMGKAKVAAHDMFQLLDREPLINGLEPTGATPAAGEKLGRVEFKEVQFHYPFRQNVQVLKGASFLVEAGTSVGLVGPSGGGKSTIMCMLQRFYDPQGGSILVGSSRTPLNEINIRWWRKQVGFVGQEPILFEGTVLNNVKYGLDDDEAISQEKLEECKRMAHLSFIDKAQGWDTQVGPRGSRLSGGQKQRVAICRALVRNPPILLLDEATSALDTQSEQVVGAALEAARAGRTSFAIAHRLSTIQDCDVIMVVGEGTILEHGKHDELMQLQDVYYKLYTATRKTA